MGSVNMSSANDLIAEFQQRGFIFQINEDKLHCRGTKEPLNPELLKLLKGRKTEIMKILQENPHLDSSSKQLSTNGNKATFDNAKTHRLNGFLETFSEKLQSEVYLVKDNGVKTPDPDILHYTEDELNGFFGLADSDLKTIKETKKIFSGGTFESIYHDPSPTGVNLNIWYYMDNWPLSKVERHYRSFIKDDKENNAYFDSCKNILLREPYSLKEELASRESVKLAFERQNFNSLLKIQAESSYARQAVINLLAEHECLPNLCPHA
jgi:hypothetical protein